jgi:hypothetical protein
MSEPRKPDSPRPEEPQETTRSTPPPPPRDAAANETPAQAQPDQSGQEPTNSEPRDEPEGDRNPDLLGYAPLAARALVFLGEILAALKLVPVLPVTQYGLAALALVMFMREVDEGFLGVAGRGRLVWPVGWALIAAIGFTQPPALSLTAIFTAAFAAFTLVEWKCRRSDYTGTWSSRAGRWTAAIKRAFRPGRAVAGAATIGGFAVIAGLLGTVLAIAIGSRKSPETNSTASTTSTGTTSTTGAAPPPPTVTTNTTSTPTTTATESSGYQCEPRAYANAQWASPAINQLLAGGAGLGPEEEGCVESLNTQYESSTGFVYGKGLTSTGRVQSIVVDSYELGPPAIFIAPATGEIEALIARYHLIGGTEKAFPRYRAGSGDFYLVNTLSNGTCMLIREKSGEAYEAPGYQLLYPSEAVAWRRIVELRGWQWPRQLADPNAAGETEVELFKPGEPSPDATITYDPKTGITSWGQNRYPNRQRDLSPSELEAFARKDLGEPTQKH